MERRRWLDEVAYADLVALCQVLPGPATSQVGFAIGLGRAGAAGGIAAVLAFTLPSALLLLAFALGAAAFSGAGGVAAVHGLKLVAVAIVAHAVWGMARTLTPDVLRRCIALVAVAIVFFGAGTLAQFGAMAMGGVAGLLLLEPVVDAEIPHAPFPGTARTGVVCLAVFAALLGALPLLAARTHWPELQLFDVFYRTGALVFGGGHVVLPLLQSQVVTSGWVDNDTFLAGYGAAQAMPGPLFAIGAFLGAVAKPMTYHLLGAALALLGLFLPGLLIVNAVLPFWGTLRRQQRMRAALRGVNAAVVGVLAAALWNPVWTSAVLRPADAVIALLGFAALTVARVAPWMVVAGIVVVSVVVGRS